MVVFGKNASEHPIDELLSKFSYKVTPGAERLGVKAEQN